MLAVLGALLTLLAPPAAAAPAAPSAAPPGTAATELRGGDALYGTSYSCTLGFNAVRDGASYGIIPGHCADLGGDWYADAQRTVPVGVTEGVSFPGNDYAVIGYTSTSVSYPGEVRGSGGAPVDVAGATDPAPGMALCHYGRVSGYHCGTLRQIGLTVNFPEGTVSGLFSANICSEPGDTGGPAFSGGKAVGIIVGSTGDCTSGGTTYYQPVKEILAAYGLTIP